MRKYLLWLMLLPILGKAQNYRTPKSSRSLISSLSIGAATHNTKVFEGAMLIGIRDNTELSTFEIGYVYKQIIDKGIGHGSNYHGVRASIDMPLYKAFGAYGTYDIIKGERWLYENISGGSLTMRNKIYGEATLGLFFAPKGSSFKFYVGIEPHHYDPSKIAVRQTPHKSSSVNLKIKYTIAL